MRVRRVLLFVMTAICISGACLFYKTDVYAAGSYTVTRDGVCEYTADSQRSSACSRMIEMGSVSWSIPSKKTLKYRYASNSYVTLTAGQYKGLPYTQVNRDFSNPTAKTVQSRINSAVSGTAEVKGVDCSSAVSYALRYGTKNNSDSSNFLKGKSSAYVVACFLYDGMNTSSGTTPKGYTYRNNLTHVGSYGSYSGYKTAGYTDKILDALESGRYYSSGDLYSNVYAKIRPGDVMIRYNTDGKGHAELVTGLKIVYKNNKIDTDASKVIITDQNSPNVTKTSSYNSSWRINREFSFKKMRGFGFIPVTLNQWKESYEICYDANGGSGAPAKQQKNQYQAINLRTTEPVRSGYTFEGWKSNSKSSSGKIYKPGERYDEERSDTLYAVWKKTESKPEEKPDQGSGSFVRYAGTDRYKTSMLAANALKSSLGVSRFDNIIVASGADYPDALAGSYLAKVKSAPVLLTGTDANSEAAVKQYISTNLNSGGTVYILGGTGVVTSHFESSLSNVNVRRLGGSSRYETNIEILRAAGAGNEDLLVCTGEGFADSLSASAVGKPILLSAKSGLNYTQQAYLDSLNINDIYLIGGSGVVTDYTGQQLDRYDDDGRCERIAGQNRYLTSVAVAKKFFPDGAGSVVLAYAQNFPDGLAGGPLALSLDSPLLLVDQSGYNDAAAFARSMGIKKAVVLGGPTLIPDSVVKNIIK